MKSGFDIKFRVSYVVIGLLLVAVSGFCIFYFLYFKKGLDVKMLEVMAFSTGSVAILTLIYHALSLENQISNQKKNNEIIQAKYTYDMLSEWHKPSMMETVSVVGNLLRKDQKAIDMLADPSKSGDFHDYLQKNDDVKKHFILVLNFFENISTMIETKHINEKIIKKAFKSLFTSTYKQVRHYIDYRQKEHPDSWSYFEKISKTWIEKDKMA